MNRRRALQCLLSAAFLPVAGQVRGDAPLVMAVYPYQTAAEIKAQFAPLLQILAAAVQREIVLRIARDYDEHVRMTTSNAVDVAYIGPAGYLTLERQTKGLTILGRMEIEGRAELGGHIVVRNDSPLKQIQALKGKRVAFTDRNSTMGYLLPHAQLLRAGVREQELQASRFLGSNENVAMAVLSGEFDAGAMRGDAFENYRTIGLRSLLELPKTSEHVFVATARLAMPMQQALQGALLRLADTPQGLAALQRIRKNATAIIPGKSADFDGLRRLLAK